MLFCISKMNKLTKLKLHKYNFKIFSNQVSKFSWTCLNQEKIKSKSETKIPNEDEIHPKTSYYFS